MAVSPVLTVEQLSISFPRAGGITPVDDLSFSIARGETLALVGESGCGKSLTSLAIMRLLDNSASLGGRILWRQEGREVDLVKLGKSEMRAMRGSDIAMIFQEPMTSLNSLHRVGDQIVEAVRLHRTVSRSQAWALALDSLRVVGVPEPERRMRAFPHELSGGLRQRVMIAMSLVCEPTLLIADEPTTALDVTIQAQILDALRRLRDELNMAMLFISHDLGVVSEIADRIAIMYAGKIVEEGSTDQVLDRPAHPYTRGLLASVPRMLDSRSQRLTPIAGTVPDPRNFPPGCRFSPRCPVVVPGRCDASPLPLAPTSDQRLLRCVHQF
ncbi:ABC transporter ATP-binding protein [Ensifer sp. ENS05]|uniref:ABC transporter ATP-binding protein n=1 Tax=Ensifer sp. ENS05 TaxID=2769277 RepID=UPI00177F167C|nr:ABC transporter ATP-binding protein [Ensifer sp. ENS05]MBD9597293.1 ABC transporter ATP-binding protein [Ensifer sp. ENS05]